MLIIDEAKALRADVLTALRVLKTRGALSLSHVRRDPVSGDARTHFMEVRGPIATLTTAGAGFDTDPLLQQRCQAIALDESPAQADLVLAAMRQRHGSTDARHVEARGQKSPHAVGVGSLPATPW